LLFVFLSFRRHFVRSVWPFSVFPPVSVSCLKVNACLTEFGKCFLPDSERLPYGVFCLYSLFFFRSTTFCSLVWVFILFVLVAILICMKFNRREDSSDTRPSEPPNPEDRSGSEEFICGNCRERYSALTAAQPRGSQWLGRVHLQRLPRAILGPQSRPTQRIAVAPKSSSKALRALA
jgi:hypothetical protein